MAPFIFNETHRKEKKGVRSSGIKGRQAMKAEGGFCQPEKQHSSKPPFFASARRAPCLVFQPALPARVKSDLLKNKM